jgi:hypothetical protein
MKLSKTAGYISEIKEIIYKAREKAYVSVNLAMIEAYWLVGKRIVEEEQKGKEKANYGEALLKNLSIALTREIGIGFSYSNLRNFRQFYLTYPNYENCYALRSKLTWTHHRLIMRVEDPKTREFYIKECEELESKIESALIQNLQKFLLELGKGFSFVARQFRISTETSHFYIDLVFYNYILKCFVLFDLKTSKLSHQDIGQLDMYVRMFDDLKRQESDNPTIGILLCTEKEETVVKYSVLNDNKQLYASKYMQYLPSEEELTREIEREKELIRKQLDKGNGI